ncbi:MAG: 2-hydroxyacid dehydrogenase [Rhodospirillaceae bacterium]|nr:2-hydroxyacid dehydrogenase [Rhodospirillaceae bacterium]MBT5177681.1 2-hydroxyacid dehydrogenase [Rhodospirillaceae bacterium]MBT5841768.1 2-hydroxyacid dehydrogenase [Rhodospirillaceae bacterium]
MDMSNLPSKDGPFPHPDPKSLNVLVTRDVGAALSATLEEAYTVHQRHDAEERRDFIAAQGNIIDVVVTSGLIGISAAEMDQMPNLKFVHSFASGYESVDVAAAKARGIMVAHMPGTMAFSVAEHAIGLMISITRGFIHNDKVARETHWDECGQHWPNLYKKRLGLLGYGNIGAEIAQRMQGFEMEIGYHARSRRDVPHAYFETPLALAEWADYVIAALPGSADTKHIVDADVLGALGPTGYFINVARGTVVDSAALDQALRSGAIAGAGIDVAEGDPEIPTALLETPNLQITPHVAGQSPEAVERKLGIIRANIENHLTGGEVLSPVKEMKD